MDKQVTLAKEVYAKGIGLHGGEMAAVVLRPRAQGGVVLRIGGEILPLEAGLVKASPLCTLLDNGVVQVSTVEHLLSALHGLGVDAVEIEVDGPEVPILDGSALPWVALIDEARRVEADAARDMLRVARPIVHDSEGRVLSGEPDVRAGLRVGCVVDFPHPAIGRQEWQGVTSEEAYRKEIAPARTFVLEKDIEAARRAGLAKGGSLDNAVVFGDDGMVKNPGGLRFVDEPVRHKVLDFMGDMFMQGRVVQGKFHLTAPGHVANNRLLKELMEKGV